MVEPTLGSFWDAIRWWASSVGLLTSQTGPGEVPPRPPVPEGVCAGCPICQAAATLEQVDPKVMADLTLVARSVISGLSAALAEAAVQRTGQERGTRRQESEAPDFAGEPPAAEESAAEEPVAEESVAASPAAERPTAQRPATEQPTEVTPTAETPVPPEPTAPKSKAVKSGAGKQAAGKPTSKSQPAVPSGRQAASTRATPTRAGSTRAASPESAAPRSGLEPA